MLGYRDFIQQSPENYWEVKLHRTKKTRDMNWAQTDSNRWLRLCKSHTLPTELWAQRYNISNVFLFNSIIILEILLNKKNFFI